MGHTAVSAAKNMSVLKPNSFSENLKHTMFLSSSESQKAEFQYFYLHFR